MWSARLACDGGSRGRACVRRGVLAGGEISIAGTCGELAAAARGNNVDLYRAEGSVFFDVGRIVSEGVLVANVAGHLIANVMNVVDVFREKRHATRTSGNILQRAHRFFAILLVFIAE